MKRLRILISIIFLAGLGVNRAALSAAGFGASQPVGDNKTVTGRALSRRITIRIVH